MSSARIPETLAVTDGAFAMDGGSICLELRGPDEATHSLSLAQAGIPENFRAGAPPGVLVFDGRALAIHGPDEAELVDALRRATYRDPRPRKRRPRAGIAPPARRAVLGDDVRAYVDAIDDDATSALRQLVAGVLAVVASRASR
jgi:hypothetical protein